MSGKWFSFSSSPSSFSFASSSSSSVPLFSLSSNPSSSSSSSPSLFGSLSPSPSACSSLFSNSNANFGACSSSTPSLSSNLFGFGSSSSSASASSKRPSLSFGFGASSSASSSSSTPFLFPCPFSHSSSSSSSGSNSPFSTSLTPGFLFPSNSRSSSASSAPEFSFPSGSISSLSSTRSSSGFQSSFGSGVASSIIASSGSTSSSQISQESTATAPFSGTPNSDGGSCLGCSPVFLKAGTSDAEERASCEDEQVRNRVIKQPGVGHEKSSENSSAGVACQTPLKSSLFTEANELTLYPQIVEQILDKYGDITIGSILKSTAAKSTFLQLVADVVHRLCNHTLDTIDCNELQLIQTRTADVVAVGFCVDWLQERVEKVVSASESQVRLMELDELDRQIDAAEKSLMEMELRRIILTEGVDSIKAEMEGNDLGGSNLGEGLL